MNSRVEAFTESYDNKWQCIVELWNAAQYRPVHQTDMEKSVSWLPDLYDVAALEVFSALGVDPASPAEEDSLNPLYR